MRKAAEDSADGAQKSAHFAQKLADGMERSARAAEKSAQTGNESLKLGRQAMVLNEQPLLETVNAQLLKPLAVNELIPVSVQTINSGRGPARNIDMRMGIFASTKWEFNFENNPVSHTATLGPSSGTANPQLNTTKSISLTQHGIEQIKEGTAHLYVYGHVEYEQPGIEKPERQSYSYCLYYVPSSDKVASSPFADCPEHPALPK